MGGAREGQGRDNGRGDVAFSGEELDRLDEIHVEKVFGVDPAGGPDKTVVAEVKDGKVVDYQVLDEDDGGIESWVG